MVSVEWRIQEEFLDSLLNLEQYDRLLFYLETTLFNNAPKLLCPSSFIIRILLTLITLDDIYAADSILHKLPNRASDVSLSQRAYEILSQLLNIVKEDDLNEDAYDAFRTSRFDAKDVEFTKSQLVDALSFIKKSNYKKRLRQPKGKKDYKEKPPSTIDEIFETPKRPKIPDALYEQELKNWSPERRRIEMELERNWGNDDGERDDNADPNLVATADRKSIKIMGNERIDSALGQQNIWRATKWCFKCSLEKNPHSHKLWKMWDRLLTLIIDILELEYRDFLQVKGTDPAFSFESTLTFSFFDTLGQYHWAQSVCDVFFRTHDAAPIFKNELRKAHSVAMERNFQESNGESIVSSKGAPLMRKIFFFACDATQQREYDTQVSERLKWRKDKLTELFVLSLRNGTYDDFTNFLQMSHEDLKDCFKVSIVEDLILCYLVQLTTYDFDQPEPEWIYSKDKGLAVMKDLFQNVTFSKKFYNLEFKGAEKNVLDDYNKISCFLFYLTKLWINCSKITLDVSIKNELMRVARVGEKSRRRVLESVLHNSVEDENTKDLSSFLHSEFML